MVCLYDAFVHVFISFVFSERTPLCIVRSLTLSINSTLQRNAIGDRPQKLPLLFNQTFLPFYCDAQYRICLQRYNSHFHPAFYCASFPNFGQLLFVSSFATFPDQFVLITYCEINPFHVELNLERMRLNSIWCLRGSHNSVF